MRDRPDNWYEMTGAEQHAWQVEEERREAKHAQMFMWGWIAAYVIAFMCFLGAIWGGTWRATVTGILVLIIGCALHGAWGIKYRGWE